MQVSIYLKPEILKKVDKKAKTAKKSRSHIIQSILEDELPEPTDKKNGSVFDSVSGVFTPKEGDKILKEIRYSRKNSKRFK